MRTPIVYDFEQVVANMRAIGEEKPYSDFGHRLEIANTLTEKEGTQYKYNRYPLLALRLDIPEIIEDGMQKVKLNIAIITFTNENYKARDRYAKVLVPILYPLYESFMVQLRRSGIFTWEGYRDYPTHEVIDRPYWGIADTEGNVKNIFQDPIDAIEIIDLKINKRLTKC
jgi:hypothetical protein